MVGIPGDINNQLIIGGLVLVVSIGILLVGPKILGKTLSLISIIGILGVIGVGISLPQIVEYFGQPTRTGTMAKSEITPQNVDFVRIFPTEFTITWKTQASVIGAIRYGNSITNLDLAAAELDPSQAKNTHMVRVTNLIPESTYYLEIISGGENFNNQGQPFQITLPSTLSH